MTDTFTTGHTLPTAITTENAVLRLRQQRLAAATRAYRARGCRAIRCQAACWPSVSACVIPSSHNRQTADFA